MCSSTSRRIRSEAAHRVDVERFAARRAGRRRPADGWIRRPRDRCFERRPRAGSCISSTAAEIRREAGGEARHLLPSTAARTSPRASAGPRGFRHDPDARRRPRYTPAAREAQRGQGAVAPLQRVSTTPAEGAACARPRQRPRRRVRQRGHDVAASTTPAGASHARACANAALASTMRPSPSIWKMLSDAPSTKRS